MNWKAAYLESRILSADPVELICILYEHAILAIEEARESLAERDIARRSRAISKAIAIIGELDSSLNHKEGGAVSANLARLYQYIRERLLAANRKQEAAPLTEVQRLLETVRAGWIAIRPAGAPPNSQAAGQPAREGAWAMIQSEVRDVPATHGWSA